MQSVAYRSVGLLLSAGKAVKDTKEVISFLTFQHLKYFLKSLSTVNDNRQFVFFS